MAYIDVLHHTHEYQLSIPLLLEIGEEEKLEKLKSKLRERKWILEGAHLAREE